MTNGLALFLIAVIAGILAMDHYVWQWDILSIAMRKLIELIRFIAFWR